jgi:hypothetical protein
MPLDGVAAVAGLVTALASGLADTWTSPVCGLRGSIGGLKRANRPRSLGVRRSAGPKRKAPETLFGFPGPFERRTLFCYVPGKPFPYVMSNLHEPTWRMDMATFALLRDQRLFSERAILRLRGFHPQHADGGCLWQLHTKCTRKAQKVKEINRFFRPPHRALRKTPAFG